MKHISILLFNIIIFNLLFSIVYSSESINEGVIEIKTQNLRQVKLTIERETSTNVNPLLKQLEINSTREFPLPGSPHFYISNEERENLATNQISPIYYHRDYHSPYLQPLNVVLDKDAFRLEDKNWIKGGLLGDIRRPIQYSQHSLDTVISFTNPFIITNRMNVGGAVDNFLQTIESYYGGSKKIFILNSNRMILEDQIDFHIKIAKKIKYLFVMDYRPQFKEINNIIWVPKEFKFASINRQSLIPLSNRKYLYFHPGSDVFDNEKVTELLSSNVDQQMRISTKKEISREDILQHPFRNSIFTICFNSSTVFESLQYGSIPLLYGNPSVRDDLKRVANPPFFFFNNLSKLETFLKYSDTDKIIKEYQDQYHDWYPKYLASIQKRIQNLIDFAIGDVVLRKDE